MDEGMNMAQNITGLATAGAVVRRSKCKKILILTNNEDYDEFI